MPAGSWAQFRILFWKNWVLQSRKKVVTGIEIGIPMLTAAIVILMRVLISSEDVKDPTIWNPFNQNNFFPTPDILDPDLAGEKWKMAYTPNNPAASDVVRRFLSRMNDNFLDSAEGLTGFDDEAALVDFMTQGTPDSNRHYGGIVFTNMNADGTFPAKIHYKLRLRAVHLSQEQDEGADLGFSEASQWMTDTLMIDIALHGPREENKTDGGEPYYNEEGFLATQLGLDLALADYLSPDGIGDDQIDLVMQRFPYPPFRDDDFIYTLEFGMYIFLYLMMVPSVFSTTKELVLEKERRLKEYMKLMGLSSFINWLSWIVKYTLYFAISIVVITAVMFIPLHDGAAALNYSNVFLVFVFLMLYAIATICYCCMMSVFFSKANNGAMASGVIFLMTAFVYSITSSNYNEMSVSQKLSTAWLHNVPMAYGWKLLAHYESQGNGLTFSTVGETPSLQENLSMLAVYFMFIFDCCLYLLIMWYVERLFPGEYGLPERWYFPCSPSYWCGSSKRHHQVVDDESLIEGSIDSTYIEKNFNTDAKAGIRIRKLRKEFKKNGVLNVAVAGTSLDMYEGQITALLGHNGAGKTTTISMLTGFGVPTSGTATINGYDIRTEMQKVRDSIGLCPQHDVLFDTLTVKEHLEFFAKLKGCTKGLDEEVNEMIRLIQLENKKNVQSAKLSGGMKRKLSVGIALIHGSKTVILDEPSSGVDPAARRQLWDILQSQRAGRTMLLTTHFMDEADYLGDRIAIMAKGEVKCCGSSLFLKSKYGVGYHMTIVKADNCNSKAVKKVIQRFVPTATVESNISAELSFLLPQNMSQKFEELFAYLEEHKESLGINSYGASVTTMEEVFLKVGKENHDTDISERINNADNKTYTNPAYTSSSQNLRPTVLRLASETGDATSLESPVSLNGSTPGSGGPPGFQRSPSLPDSPIDKFTESLERSTGTTLQLRQFKAMFVKRVIHTMRNKVVSISQVVIPIVFVILAGVLLKSLPDNNEDPEPLPINYIQYLERANQYVVYSTESTTGLTGGISSAYNQYLADNVTGITDVSDHQEGLVDYLWKLGEDDRFTYANEYMVAADFAEVDTTHTSITAMFNNQPFHTTTLAVSMITNAILMHYTDDEHTLEITNHPLPRSEEQKVEDSVGSSALYGYIVMGQVLIGMSFLVSTFVVFLVKEKTVKAKHIQFVSGVHAINYWGSTYLWDIINYTVPALLVLPVFIGFDIPGTTGWNILIVFMVLMFYAWAVIPLVYSFSFVFTVASSAYVWVTVINMVFGHILLGLVNNLMLPGSSTYEAGEIIDWFGTVTFPSYTMTRALQMMMTNHYNEEACENYTDDVCEFFEINDVSNPCCDTCKDNCIKHFDNLFVWENPGIGRYFLFMLAQGVVFFVLLIALESGLLSKAYQAAVSSAYNTDDDEQDFRSSRRLSRSYSKVDEDDDVLAERRRITQTPIDSLAAKESLILSNLRKFYGNFRAVNKLSVGVPRGECFGLLGVNGAGKTTTFKMMTGDEMISSGQAYLDGYSVNKEIKKVQQRLGYCPQFDALIEQMTVTEHLYMYARLRGVREKQIKDLVENLIDDLLLTDHKKKMAKDLSGGNKRKLSTAIALIGDPPIVFLDEPTTGMDPLARRLLWDTLNKVRASGRTLVLTSHSMEECEALCTRIAIMVNGEFKCLGSTQHLKTKFGEGYSLMARVSGYNQEELEERTERMMEFIQQKFPGCQLKDMHQGLVHYQLDQQSTTWSNAFGTLERNKEALHINDYSVSQTTLEQVFISFARAQEAPVHSDIGAMKKFGLCCKFMCCCGCCKS